MKNKNTAFTLIELLVAIVIIGILATISVNTFQGYFEKARLAKARASAGQIKSLFLAQNASTEENLFTAWYNFDGVSDVNQMNPYIIDKSEAKNNLTYVDGSGTFSRDIETGVGAGGSLKIDQKRLGRNGTVPGGPENKLTMATWFKLDDDFSASATYPMSLNSSAGFEIHSTGRVKFYINGGGYSYVFSDIGSIDINKWHYIIGSYDGDAIKLWIDGDLIGTNDGVAQTVDFQGRGLYLGYSNFKGWIDDAMSFPYAFDGTSLK